MYKDVDVDNMNTQGFREKKNIFEAVTAFLDVKHNTEVSNNARVQYRI